MGGFVHTRRGVLGAAGGAIAAACAAQEGMEVGATEAKPIIFHTDIGYDVDDTWALLQIMRTPQLATKLVATDFNNTRYRARLTAKLLTLGGLADVPLALGPSPTDEAGPQSAWVGDYDLSTYRGLVEADSASAIIAAIRVSPEPLTLLSVGPATSIGLALSRDPGIAPLAHFVGMFGSVRVGYGDTIEPIPEYNVKTDVAAFRAIVAAPWRSCTITPLDTCGTLVLTGERYQRLRASADPFARAAIANTEVWRPHAFWMPPTYDPNVASSTLFDSAAVLLAYDESYFEIEELPIAVRDDGMTVTDAAQGHRIRCAMRWRNLDGACEAIVSALTREG